MTADAGECDAPLKRLMISSATAGEGDTSQGILHPPYDKNNPPTPATLVTDLKATDFRSAIGNLDDDGAGGPIPYVDYNQRFDHADEVHEDESNNYIFCPPEDFAESTADVDRGMMVSELNERVFFVVLHTDRWDPRHIAHCVPKGSSSDVLLFALGVSAITGNLVGVMAIQVCHNNLCD